MATSEQRHKLRVKLQDYTDKDGNILTPDLQAFNDAELEVLIDDGITESREAMTIAGINPGDDDHWGILLARVDGLLMVAQDESRRIRWQVNNKVFDETQVSRSLIAIARELRERFDNAMQRRLDAGRDIGKPPTSGRMDFNTSVPSNSDRNFMNSDVRRNLPRH